MRLWPRRQTQTHRVTKPTKFLPGTVLHTEHGYFLVQKLTRVEIPEQVLNSWNFDHIVEASESAVKAPVLGKLGFRDGTLLHCGGEFYIVSDRKAVRLRQPDVEIPRHGLSVTDALAISESDLTLHREVIK